MNNEEKDCGCGHGLSRRGMLKAGLAAAATAAIGLGGDALAEKEAGGAGANQASADHRRRASHRHSRALLSAVVLRCVHRRWQALRHGISQDRRRLFLQEPAGNQPVQPMKFIDLKLRIADMDQQGIAVQAVSLTSPMVYWGDEDFSHKLSRAWNDGASAAHQQYPDRIVCADDAAHALPRPRHRRAQSREQIARACAASTSARTLTIRTISTIRCLSRSTRASKRSICPCFCTRCRDFGGARMQPYYLSNLLGNPYDTAIAACKLIIGGVMDRHPKLQVCLPHGGGALPILIGRVDHGYRVRQEVKKMNLPKPPSEYLQPLHLRHDRALEAHHGISDSAGWRRANHDRQRLLLRYGLRPARAIPRADQSNERAAQDDPGRQRLADPETVMAAALPAPAWCRAIALTG